ncbi:MAG TPA: hypothetical protein VG406_08460 [Isosphaeraceae bacterium]|jgi:hypothetical protein|nr:hypothetical protein [Isosphaeraceae bacterium]
MGVLSVEPTPAGPEVATGVAASRRRFAILVALFVAEAAGFLAVTYPGLNSFTDFCFADFGADLCSFELMRRGRVPVVDFGYIYGLIPLVLGDYWYRLTGLGPTGWKLWCAATTIALVVSSCRYARRVEAGPAGWALMALALPILLSRKAVVFAKGIEPLLLIASLTALVGGRRGAALCWAMACVFVKSGLSACWAAALGALIVAREWRRPSRLARELAPAAGLGVALFAATAWRFGPLAATRSIVPLDGARVYAENHFGFFRGIGRNFWAPPGARWTYYLGTPAGSWLAASAVLVVGGVLAARRLWLGRTSHAGRDEAVVLCAIAHTTFVTMMYGNAWSWGHYGYILILGVVAASTAGRLATAATIALAALSIPADAGFLRHAANLWRRTAPSPATYGLHASDRERSDWAEIRRRIDGESAALLAVSDGAAVIDRRFAPPCVFYLDHAEARPAEVEDKLQQLRACSMVVCWTPVLLSYMVPPERFPEFAPALADFEVVLDRPPFRLYRRVRGAAGRPSSPPSAVARAP